MLCGTILGQEVGFLRDTGAPMAFGAGSLRVVTVSSFGDGSRCCVNNAGCGKGLSSASCCCLCRAQKLRSRR